MITKQHLFLDIHAIQTVPPSNINRDDTGSPKTAQYGGVRRARVSSQSWKSAMRKYFKSKLQENTGYRTLRIVEAIANNICKIDQTIDLEEAKVLSNSLLKRLTKKKNSGKTEAVFAIDDEHVI